ncbi:MAG: hypothetical protein CM1200mP22_08040 [Dehalococcoidia bacterium]|nr:MAG: hypothetical protein CM1200mP22_08040 [Dehalococcoidia bacterium]
MATSRSAANIGVRGKTIATSGSTHGKAAVEKKVPAKNIIGIATALPMPEAAAGDLAQADRINPIFKNTMLPKIVMTNTHRRFP